MTPSHAGASSVAPTVVVIGAGIIGLACALQLQAELARGASGARVVVVAREWPSSVPGAPRRHTADYASMWAGAHVRPIPATTPQLQREAAWLRVAVAELGRQADAEPWCGVSRVRGVELLEAPDGSYRDQDGESFAAESGLGGYRRLAAGELPAGVALGFEYDTFCINPAVYCDHLLRRFLLRGGETAQRDLGSEWEAFALRPGVLLVVNASGRGFGDAACFPTRGQTVVTNLARVAKTVTRQNRDGTWSFLIPRGFDGGTVVGGTKEPHDWRTEPDAATRERLVAAGLALERLARADDDDGGGDGAGGGTSAGDVGVVGDIVGRRPTRAGGLRLEVEERARAGAGAGGRGRVVHAYGAGGRGYEMSWGVAREAAQLAMAVLQGERGAAPCL